MSQPENKPEITFDASGLTSDQLLNQLAGMSSDAKVRVIGLSEELCGTLAGFDQSLEVNFASGIGPYAFMAARQAAFEVESNVAIGCGHSFQSGSILIRGDANNFLAAYAVGGYIAIHGRAGDYVGYGLAGADVLVRSRCGNGVGTNMRSGTLVLGNGCRENLGQGMTGGAIYVRGEVGSVAEEVQAGRLKETDTIRLSLMLVRAGIKTTYGKFQVFRAKTDKGI
jgi:glutamate synthase domain-containing protein 3